MPIHIFTGDDEYLISRAVNNIKATVVPPDWFDFNFTTVPPVSDSLSEGCNQLGTPPMGSGGRVVYLPQSSWLKPLEDDQLNRVKVALGSCPETNHLVLTANKLDKRLKSVKFLLKAAREVKDFPMIASWDEKRLVQQVKAAADDLNVFLTPTAITALADAVGNDTRRLYSELEKLTTYCNGGAVNAQAIKDLVSSSTASSIDLAKAILGNDGDSAIALLDELIATAEPPLKIIATLTTMFRQWLWVKVLVAEGVACEQVIADHLGLHNANRVFYLRQEVNNISLEKLKTLMAEVLEAEICLKSGCNNVKTLITRIITKAWNFSPTSPDNIIFEESSVLLNGIN